MDMASYITSYAKAVRSKSENSHEIVVKHRSSYNSNSNGISRSLGTSITSSAGDMSENEDTNDWPELKTKVVPAPIPTSNPWLQNPNAAAVIAMKFSNSTSTTINSSSATPVTNSQNNDNEKPSTLRRESSNSHSHSIQPSSSPNAKTTEPLDLQPPPSTPTQESNNITNNSSGEKHGGGVNNRTTASSVASGPVKNVTRSPIKSNSQIRSGPDRDTSSLPPRYDRQDRHSRGRGRGGNSSRGRGGGSSYRGGGGGGKNYHQITNTSNSSSSNHINYYSADPNAEPSLIISPPTTREEFPPEFTPLTPMYAPIQSDFIMPYITTFPPTPFAAPIDTTGIQQQPTSFPSFLPVDAYETNQRIEMVKNQIEYYFSDENLEKDFYLRRKMDPDGYIPVQMIASFYRIKKMTEDYGIVVAAVQLSDKLECTPDVAFVRALNNPLRWPITDEHNMVSLSISLTAMSLAPMLPSPSSASSSVDVDADSELDGTNNIMSTSSPIDIVSAIHSSASNSASNGRITMVSATNGNGHHLKSEMFNPNVPEFVPRMHSC